MIRMLKYSAVVYVFYLAHMTIHIVAKYDFIAVGEKNVPFFQQFHSISNYAAGHLVVNVIF